MLSPWQVKKVSAREEVRSKLFASRDRASLERTSSDSRPADAQLPGAAFHVFLKQRISKL
jgi:hypothetical protein